ncbi:hypothetical protein ACFL4T_07730 [candidate division KSB1 bacterium]
MKSKLFIIVVLILCSISYASDKKGLLRKNDKKLKIFKTENSVLLSMNVLPGLPQNISDNGRKSYLKGALFSLILPGAGEFYNKEYIKGAVFTAVEVVSWVVFFKYNDLGKKKEDEFERFADAHWDADGYREYVSGLSTIPDHFTHTLPETNTQQYYEMIGKYNQFAPWWDDYDESEGDSEIRYDYMDVRYESNRHFKKKRTATMAMLLNRLFSVLDTTFKIKKHNELYAGIRYRKITDDNYGFSLTLNW